MEAGDKRVHRGGGLKRGGGDEALVQRRDVTHSQTQLLLKWPRSCRNQISPIYKCIYTHRPLY